MLAAPSSAHAGSYDPTLHTERISLREGLPRDAVHAVTQDGSGLIWIGTASGLARYDGVEVTSYPRAPADGRLSDSNVVALHTDKRGDVWVGTASGGLNRIDHERGVITAVRAKDGLSGDAVTALASSGDTLWVGTQTGLTAVDLATGNLRVIRHDEADASSLVDDRITALFAEASAVWIGTPSGVDRLEVKTGAISHFSKSVPLLVGETRAIVRDQADTLWIGTTGGLYRVSGDLVTVYVRDPRQTGGLPADSISALLVDRDGTLWIGAERNGVIRYAPERPRFLHDLPGTWINALYQGQDGVIWAATEGDGLRRIPPQAFKAYLPSADAERSGLRPETTAAGLYQRDSVLWIAGKGGGGGLYRLDRKSDELTHFATAADGSPIGDAVGIAVDGAGLVWAATIGGALIRLDPATGQAERLRPDPGRRDGLPSGRPTRVAVDGQGRLWVGTADAGVARYDASAGRFIPYAAGEQVLALAPDVQDPDRVWFGGATGLRRLDLRSGEVVSYRHDPAVPDGLGDDEITALYQEPSGRLWIATRAGGLNALDPDGGKFERYGAAQGLPSDVVSCVTGDGRGAIWVSTPSGVAWLDRDKGTIRTYGRTDGVAPAEPADGACFADPLRTEVIFGAARGFTVARTSDVIADEPAPRVAITRVRRFNQEVPLGKGAFDLSWRDTLTVDFTLLDYAGDNSGYYMLEGWDRDWKRSRKWSVTYNGLPPGAYRLRFKGANRHGLESEREAVLSLRVQPPPWRTWWAYTSYVAASMLIVAGFLEVQRRRVERLRERVRLAEAESDLGLIAAAQSWFLPKQPVLKTPNVEVCGFYEPASKCAGDWWWYEEVPGGILILVGDVTGHGAGPAIITASIATSLRATRGHARSADVPWRLGHLHREIADVCAGVYLMTISALLVDTASARARFYAAGGLPAIHLGANGVAKAIIRSGSPLGSPRLVVGEATFDLHPGDRIFLLTDGLPEIPQPNGRFVGTKKVIQMVSAGRGLGLQDLVQNVRREAVALRGDTMLDDITFVGVEWRGEAGGAEHGDAGTAPPTVPMPSRRS